MAVATGWKRVTYADDSGDTWTELMRDSRDHTDVWSSITCTNVEDDPDLTAEEMITALQSSAEGENYHEWVGLYESLHVLVEKHSSTAAADAFIAEVFGMGGLHGR